MMVNRLQTYSIFTLLGFLLPGPILVQASQNELLNRLDSILEEAQEIRNRLNLQPAVSNDFYQQDFTTQINNNLTRWVVGVLAHSLASIAFIGLNILVPFSGIDFFIPRFMRGLVRFLHFYSSSPTLIFLDSTLKVLLMDTVIAYYLQHRYQHHLYLVRQRFWYFFRILGSMCLISAIPALGALGMVQLLFMGERSAAAAAGFIIIASITPYICFKLIFTFVMATSMICILNRSTSLRGVVNRLC